MLRYTFAFCFNHVIVAVAPTLMSYRLDLTNFLLGGHPVRHICLN